MRGTVILVAAGSGIRLGRGPKALLPIGGVAMVRRAADCAAASERVEDLVVAVTSEAGGEFAAALEGLPRPWRLVPGGATRQASVRAALELVTAESVAVHDAARPLCPPALFDRAFAALDDGPAAVCACPVADTVKRVREGRVEATLERSALVAAQTPQAFRTDVLRRAHRAAEAGGWEATDDATLVERAGVEVLVVEGSERNLKVTTPTDLALAEALLEAR